ncbi:MAG: DUF1592 domain-containing protein [Bryobacterales bacterium]|nr:DUF1592 domain-containing protein [Bryobacterales bacterium]
MHRLFVWFAFFAALLGAQTLPQAFTEKYCVGCHNPRVKSGAFVIEGALADVWEKAAKRVRFGEMPPPGAPRPTAAEGHDFASAVTREFDAAARQTPFAGRPVIHRLNRTEYSHAVRDLLHIELPELATELPQDQAAGGFDNIADALSMSPLLLERYLKVARRVSELATGTGDASPVVEIFPARGSQAVWQGDGMPFGTRGGIRVTHYFPRDGDYDLRAFLVKESLTPTEGVRFFRTRLTGVKAGSHTVVVTFPEEYAEREGPVLNVGGPGGAALGGPLDVWGSAVRPTIDFRLDGRRVKLFEIYGMNAGEAAFDGLPGPPALGRIEIAGPYHAGGPGETPSRARIFTCKPAEAGEEAACAGQILTPIVRRAFRRTVSPADLRPFLKTFETARRGGRTFEAAIAAAIRDVLIAPDFLFRLELAPNDAAPGAAYRLTDFDIASRLSFFLWSTIPDDTLLDAAASGKLRGGAGIDSEVRRMLRDTRASALLDHFATQWLGLGTLMQPDKDAFPEYDPALAAAFQTETRLFINSLLRENRSVLDVLGADYTYLDERLAHHYGIPGVTGPGFRRVRLEGHAQRGGLLSHGSILLQTSHATRTSPVLRGKWILDNLLNSPPPAPPANVPTLEESTAGAGRKLTAREMVERHRANPSCASCHARIDPLGFALENYDVIGRWRARDEGGAIDTSGKLLDGTSFAGPAELKKVLMGRDGAFVHATVERLLTYAIGRELEARDQPAVRDIMRQTAPGGYRFHDVIIAIARSVPFTMRQKQE